MVTNGLKADWQHGQNALRKEVQRVTALLRSIEDPTPHAVGEWNLGEVAMHLSQAWVVVGPAPEDRARTKAVDRLGKLDR
ncbi:MAG: hypothetical protein M3332_06705 [Actinomycetota bacterium]|nr:hypothetical protein [Actinomycetota bacterium]